MKPIQSNSGRIIFEHCDIVTPETVVQDGSLLVEDGRIARIERGAMGGSGVRYDAGGRLLFPGAIDLHSDALEKYIEPRPGSFFPFSEAIVEFDKTLPACGITTMFHCVAFACDEAKKRVLRNNETAEKVLQEIHHLTPWLRTRTRIHIRYDIINRAALPVLHEHAGCNSFHLLSFMDHTPGQGQFHDIEFYRQRMLKDYNYTREQLENHIDSRSRAQTEISQVELAKLAAVCHENKIPLASHDDDSSARIEWAKSLEIGISEFPVCMEALGAANRGGMWTMFGAPNVLRGKSQSGNMSATELMESGQGDILASDYAPMSMFHAALKMVRNNGISLSTAANWISLNPAKAVGIDHETGALEVGKAADIVVIDQFAPVPHVVATMIAGEFTYRTSQRFLNSNTDHIQRDNSLSFVA